MTVINLEHKAVERLALELEPRFKDSGTLGPDVDDGVPGFALAACRWPRMRRPSRPLPVGFVNRMHPPSRGRSLRATPRYRVFARHGDSARS